MMWRGIRVRVTAVATAAVVIVLILTAVALLAIQRRLLTENLDESLVATVSELATSFDDGVTGDPLAPRGDDDAIAQIAMASGDVVTATANYRGRPALPPPPPDGNDQVRTARLLEDEPTFRIVSRHIDGHVIHVASPTDDIDESIAALGLALAGSIPVVTIVLAALIWWIVGRTLRPVEAIRREVAGITGRQLHRRVPEPATHDEIQLLASTMNAMLDRVERAADSQRRFVADASHELRSPLTRVRSELEVDLAHPATADSVATHRSVLEETEQMQRLVEDLLTLARHDDASPNGSHDRPVVDLDDIVLHDIARRRPTTHIGIDAGAVSAAQVRGDGDQLARLVRNVIDNAVRHARTVVTVTLSQRAGDAVLAVVDDGPGIPPEQHERVFERFARVDEARTSNDGGTGLGLAIARAIAEDHRGSIHVDPGHRPGACVVIVLPIAATESRVTPPPGCPG